MSAALSAIASSQFRRPRTMQPHVRSYLSCLSMYTADKTLARWPGNEERATSMLIPASPTGSDVQSKAEIMPGKLASVLLPRVRNSPTALSYHEDADLFSSFCSFVRAYWSDKEVDADAFHITIMSILPKKGDLSDPNKWWGISLLSCASKIISSVIANRLAR